ncbi:MAG: glycosyltransferase [Agathobacter rectalis]
MKKKSEDIKFTVVLVTYNRIIELKKTLELYDQLNFLPCNLIVVNNSSTDGTEKYLNDWKNQSSKYNRFVITTNYNLGGAGGFSVGIKKAVETECDFIFLADDDAYPDQNVLFRMANFYCNQNKKNDIAGMCTKNINYGKIDCMHRRRVKKGILCFSEKNVDISEYNYESFDVDEFSFVGAAIKKNIVLQIGLPRSDYFIYFDDSEYSLRIRENGRIVCVTDAVMNHNTVATEKKWGYYYAVRNRLDMVKRHGSGWNYLYYKILSYLKYCSWMSYLFKWKSKPFINMCKRAMKDSKTGVFGYCESYPPGKDI